jgi:spermidine/putrescine transport system permease protein
MAASQDRLLPGGRRMAGYGLVFLLILLLAAPLLTLLVLSFFRQDGLVITPTFTTANYGKIFELSEKPVFWMGIPFYFKYPLPAVMLVKSLLMSLGATLAIILTAYPMAYFLAFRVTRYKLAWIILLTIPFWTSYLLRVFAWKIVLGFNGAINSGLISLGIIKEPLEFLLYNPAAVMITLTHAWVAFAILPIYVSLQKIDRTYIEAATDLGDTRWQRFRRVTLPLSMPGVISASLLVFIPTVGDYVTPTLVGGPGGVMVGNVIQSLFFRQNDAPLGAAVALVMLVVIALLSFLFLWAVGYKEIRRRSVR